MSCVDVQRPLCTFGGSERTHFPAGGTTRLTERVPADPVLPVRRLRKSVRPCAPGAGAESRVGVSHVCGAPPGDRSRPGHRRFPRRRAVGQLAISRNRQRGCLFAFSFSFPGRGQHEPRPQRLRHAEPSAVDARAYSERQPGPFHIHTQPDRFHICHPHAEHELVVFSDDLSIFQPSAQHELNQFGLPYRQRQRDEFGIPSAVRQRPATRAPAESERRHQLAHRPRGYGRPPRRHPGRRPARACRHDCRRRERGRALPGDHA